MSQLGVGCFGEGSQLGNGERQGDSQLGEEVEQKQGRKVEADEQLCLF